MRTRHSTGRPVTACAIIATITSLSTMLLVSSSNLPVHADTAAVQVDVWMTTPDRAQLLAPQQGATFRQGGSGMPQTITVNPSQTYQTMAGFGASFTDSSAWLVANSPQRDSIMTKLFDRRNGIGLSFLRQPVGASDFARSMYTYNDVPSGQTDHSLSQFSVDRDHAYVLPVLRQARQVNPGITVMASPWSAPAWMKTSRSLIGGRLNPSEYQVYANYLVKFIQAYQAAGVPVSLLTPQNEPGYSPPDYPGMPMSSDEQAKFIASTLGPAISNAGLTTRIVAYDHNWDDQGYPLRVFNDSAAANFVVGSAFHCYAGQPNAQSNVHNTFPSKDIYFTECTGIRSDNTFRDTLGWQTRNLVIDSIRNWAKSVVLWNLALDPNGGPTMNAGCVNKCTGVVTVDNSAGSAVYNAEYYVLGQVSKFVQSGATRIESNSFGHGNIEDVAFRNPDGSTVLVVHNDAASSQSFGVSWQGQSFSYSLPAGAVATFTWSGSSSGGTAPIIRSGWRASASSTPTNPCCASDVANHAIDGNLSTRWSTGVAQQSGQWFQIDLGSAQRFSKIVLDAGPSTGDYPRGYAVYTSTDPSRGDPIATGNGNGQVTTIDIPATTTRYLRIVQTGAAGNWWSIAELNLYP